MGSTREISAEVNRELSFFGKVTASATHQIKNELAVINETGNLVVEILALAEQGRELNPDRIKTLAERVVTRVENSNVVVKRLNAFAHSAEVEVNLTNTRQALELMVYLYQRPAGLKSITLDLAPLAENDPLEVPLRPFLVEQVIWAALENTVAAAPPDSRITLSLTRSDKKVVFKLSGPFSDKPAPPPGELLNQSSVRAETGAGALCLEFKT